MLYLHLVNPASSIFITLTRGGPPRYNEPVPFTITASSHIVGTYAPPAVQGPHTTAIYTDLNTLTMEPVHLYLWYSIR